MAPRITYQCSGRTFDRLFKEKSLDQMKNVVRKKLGLHQDDTVELERWRSGKKIDLEDDDDFEAFKDYIKTNYHATISVIIRKSSTASTSPRTDALKW